MASATEHQERANHNEALLLALEKLDTHPDWYITAAFYAAVHWLRAFLALHRVGRSEEITYQEFPQHLRDIARITGLKVEHLYQLRLNRSNGAIQPEQSEQQKRRAAGDGLKLGAFPDFRELDAARLNPTI